MFFHLSKNIVNNIVRIESFQKATSHIMLIHKRVLINETKWIFLSLKRTLDHNACWFIRIIPWKVSISIQRKSCVLHWNTVSKNKLHTGFQTRQAQCTSCGFCAVFLFRFPEIFRNISISNRRKFSFARSNYHVAFFRSEMGKFTFSSAARNLCTNNKILILKRQKEI